ncbi:MerR family transcriptional regulator [Streptomyces decoyicus]|uniref:MerR family transcriptional regulator n=1 Tax=Streptomyces decoyicus TaxID=249567 RepID=UPI002E18443A|nr:MerR family transcriptional regulator [Streptomyces decoyicus]
MDDTEELLTIGAFARRVGLAPSALRFYDDCGVLRPARVDAVTGYRRYGAGQAARAVKVRQLRAAGLPLVDVAVVLDGPEDAARGVLRTHLERTRRTADETRAVVEGFLREATGAMEHHGSWAWARVGGAELASAVRQVAPAVATGRTGRNSRCWGVCCSNSSTARCDGWRRTAIGWRRGCCDRRRSRAGRDGC